MKRKVLILSALMSVVILAGCRNGQPANTIKTPGDAAGCEIGVLYGTSSYQFAADLGNVNVYNTGSELMDALKAGTLDCVLMEGEPAEVLASKTSGVRLLPEPLLEFDLSFVVAKENADLKKAVNDALFELYENGTLRGLRDRYILGKKFTYTPPVNNGEPRATLKLAVSGDFPPYSYKTVDGEFLGIDIDTARAVCDILNVDMEITETKKLVTAVQFGKADFALGCLYDNEADRELVDFSDPYTHFTQRILVRK